MKKNIMVITLILAFVFLECGGAGKVNSQKMLAVYVNEKLESTIPPKGEAVFYKAICDGGEASWDEETWSLSLINLQKKTKCNLYFYEGDTVFDYDYTGDVQTFEVPVSGTYQIELWGASGGGSGSAVGGNGAYVSGKIELSKEQKLYIYVGQNNTYTSDMCYPSNPNTTFNGSIVGTCSVGGGATDVRLTSTTNWYDFDSLKSRIMVAAGGGGAIYAGKAGSGGGLIGYTGTGSRPGATSILGAGATQTGSIFGVNKITMTTIGGGGYYVGDHGQAANAGGASSFISGHAGCNAIKKESTESNIIHTGQSIHYSNLYFTDTLMIDGEGYKWTTEKGEYTGMPSHGDNLTIAGNTGNGYARITLVSID